MQAACLLPLTTAVGTAGTASCPNNLKAFWPPLFTVPRPRRYRSMPMGAIQGPSGWHGGSRGGDHFCVVDGGRGGGSGDCSMVGAHSVGGMTGRFVPSLQRDPHGFGASSRSTYLARFRVHHVLEFELHGGPLVGAPDEVQAIVLVYFTGPSGFDDVAKCAVVHEFHG